MACANQEEFWARMSELEAEPAPEREPTPSDDVLIGYAPTALLDGAWLAPWLEVRISNTELGGALLEAFSHEVGNGNSSQHHGNLYRAALAAAGSLLEDPSSRDFAYDPRFGAPDFELALVGLEAPSLAWALGVHTFVCRHGPPEPVHQALQHTAFQRAHAPGSDGAAHAERLARRCLDAYAALPSADWTAVWRGALAVARARRAWLQALEPGSRRRSVEQAMLDLIRQKAPHAHGYHSRLVLGERSLDAHLSPTSLDARSLLSELATSRYVVAGKADESPLLVAAARFGGPMFGVFTDSELELIRIWIRTLSREHSADAVRLLPSVRPAIPAPRIEPRVFRAETRQRDRARAGLRELYQELLARDPSGLPEGFAARHAETLLARSRRAASRRRLAADGLWPYSPERLWAWIDRRHRKQVEVPRAGVVDRVIETLTREQTLWLLTQLAPAALVDGAWLSGLLRPERLSARSAGLLFRIYRDELGAGLPRQHHGNVLRSALAEAGVELPATGSRDFAESELFLDSAFSMPVYWLALARATPAFWPELLGLNMAVEIAGLGAGYERAAALLRKHRIDPYFFELHNAIDNPASGHTAWSGRAIAMTMDELVARGDEAHVDRVWQRVWTGFASYDCASKPLVTQVLLRLGPKLLLGSLRSTFVH